jgi:chaperonin GroES
MKLLPNYGRVVVLPEEKKESAGGLVMPDNVTREHPEIGTIVSVGESQQVDGNGDHLKLSFQIGDKVVFKKYSPDRVELEGEEYLILHADEILATIATV